MQLLKGCFRYQLHYISDMLESLKLTYLLISVTYLCEVKNSDNLKISLVAIKRSVYQLPTQENTVSRSAFVIMLSSFLQHVGMKRRAEAE